MKSVEQRVVDLVVTQSGFDKAAVILEANLYEDLSLDSLDMVELCMKVEAEFHISIPDEAVESLMTVGQVIAYVEKNAII